MYFFVIFAYILLSRNKHIMIDLGTGNNNKINWAMEDKQVDQFTWNNSTYSEVYTKQLNNLLSLWRKAKNKNLCVL